MWYFDEVAELLRPPAAAQLSGTRRMYNGHCEFLIE